MRQAEQIRIEIDVPLCKDILRKALQLGWITDEQLAFAMKYVTRADLYQLEGVASCILTRVAAELVGTFEKAAIWQQGLQSEFESLKRVALQKKTRAAWKRKVQSEHDAYRAAMRPEVTAHFAKIEAIMAEAMPKISEVMEAYLAPAKFGTSPRCARLSMTSPAGLR